jgi:7-cyano-7-deazaguanine synthase
MNPKFVVHLLSGGLDSVTLLYDLVGQGCKVHCVLFDYHQQHVQELTFAKLHCHRLNVLFTTVQLPKLGGLTDKSWIVPNRNAIMLMMAVNVAVEAGAESVTIGCNADDAEMFHDCRWAAIDALNHALKVSHINVEICAPYINKRKWQIAGAAREMGVPANEIWTCYRGGAKPCGTCPACLKLKEAMAA